MIHQMSNHLNSRLCNKGKSNAQWETSVDTLKLLPVIVRISSICPCNLLFMQFLLTSTYF